MNTKKIKKIAVTATVTLASLLLSASLAQAATFAPITSQMGIGSRGTSVTSLQTFLASDSNTYPCNPHLRPSSNSKPSSVM